MLKKLVSLIGLSLIAALVLAACGDDDDPTATIADARPQDTGGANHVRMLDTMRFDPDTITVEAGREVTVDLENAGMIPHTFTIDEANVDVELGARDRETFSFIAPVEPGEYEIYCAIPGHRQAGMVATLVVE